MAIEAARLTVEVDADTGKAEGDLNRLGGAVDQAGSRFGRLSEVAGGFVLGSALTEAPRILMDMAQSAADDAASMGRLEQAVANAEGAFAGHEDAINGAIKAGQELAFSDDDVRDSLSLMTATTGDADEALRRLGTAQDLARGTGMDLVTASKLLGRVSDENINVLSRYGIQVEKGATSQELLNKVDAAFKGQAGKFAESSAGQMARAADSAGELGEAVGGVLIPAFDAIASVATPVLQFLAENSTATAAAIGAVLVPAVIALAGAWIVANAAMLPFIAAAAAVGAAVFLLVKYWDPLTERFPVIQQAFDKLKSAMQVFVKVASAAFPGLGKMLQGFGEMAIAAFRNPLILIEGFAKALWRLFTGDFKGALDAGKETLDNFQRNLLNWAQGTQLIIEGAAEAGAAGIDAIHEAAEDPLPADKLYGPFLVYGPKLTDMVNVNIERLGALDAAVMAGTETWFRYADGAQTAWEAQQSLNGQWTQANSDVQFWETNLSNAQSALDILNGEIEENGGLNEEQQRQYDILTQAVGRYQGGIEDTEGAVVDAAEAQAKFILRQDELNQGLADGTINQADYNREMTLALGAIDPAAGASYGLATAQQEVAKAVLTVVEKVEGLLVKLGLIPAEKSTDISTPGADDAITDVDTLQGKINGLPTSFTIYAQLDYTAFDAGIVHIAGFTPHSPAKEGPLKKLPNWNFLTQTMPHAMTFGVDTISAGSADIAAYMPMHSPADRGPLAATPDWDYLFAGLEASAGKYSEETLDHIKTFLDAAKAAYDTFSAGLDVGGQLAAGGALPTDEQLTELKQRAEHAVQSISDSAALFKKQGLEKAKVFAEAGKAIFELFGATLEAFSGDDLHIPTDAEISRLKFVVEHAVRSIQDTALVMDADGVQAAEAFATAAGVVMEMIGTAIGAFTSDEWTIPSDARISRLKFAIEHTVQSIMDTALVMDQDGVAAAAGFSSSAETVMDLVGTAIKAFTTDDWEIPTDAKISRLKFAIEHTVESLMWTALTLDTDGVAAAGVFADGAGKVLDLVGGAIDTLVKLNELDEEQTAVPQAGIAGVVVLAVRTIKALAEAATMVSTEGFTAARTFADGAGSVLATVGDGVTALAALDDLVIPGDVTAGVQAIVALTEEAVAAMIEAAEGMDEDGLDAATQFADAGGEVLGMISGGVQGLADLGDAKFTKQVDQGLDKFLKLVDRTVRKVALAASQMDEDAISAADAYATAAKAVVDLIGAGSNDFAGLGDFADTVNRHIDGFFDSIRLAVQKLIDLGRELDAGLDEAAEIAKKINEIVELLTPASRDSAATGGGGGGGRSGGGFTNTDATGFDELTGDPIPWQPGRGWTDGRTTPDTVGGPRFAGDEVQVPAVVTISAGDLTRVVGQGASRGMSLRLATGG